MFLASRKQLLLALPSQIQTISHHRSRVVVTDLPEGSSLSAWFAVSVPSSGSVGSAFSSSATSSSPSLGTRAGSSESGLSGWVFSTSGCCSSPDSLSAASIHSAKKGNNLSSTGRPMMKEMDCDSRALVPEPYDQIKKVYFDQIRRSQEISCCFG